MAVLRVMDLAEPLWPLTLAAGTPVRGAVVAVLGHALFSPVAGLQPTATAGCIAQARMRRQPGSTHPKEPPFAACPSLHRRPFDGISGRHMSSAAPLQIVTDL